MAVVDAIPMELDRKIKEVKEVFCDTSSKDSICSNSPNVIPIVEATEAEMFELPIDIWTKIGNDPRIPITEKIEWSTRCEIFQIFLQRLIYISNVDKKRGNDYRGESLIAIVHETMITLDKYINFLYNSTNIGVSKRNINLIFIAVWQMVEVKHFDKIFHVSDYVKFIPLNKIEEADYSVQFTQYWNKRNIIVLPISSKQAYYNSALKSLDDKFQREYQKLRVKNVNAFTKHMIEHNILKFLETPEIDVSHFCKLYSIVMHKEFVITEEEIATACARNPPVRMRTYHPHIGGDFEVFLNEWKTQARIIISKNIYPNRVYIYLKYKEGMYNPEVYEEINYDYNTLNYVITALDERKYFNRKQHTTFTQLFAQLEEEQKRKPLTCYDMPWTP